METDVSTSGSATTELKIDVTLSGATSDGKSLTGTALDVLLLGDFQMKVY